MTGLFDLLGAAGAGLTRGMATSEQFKFQQREKEKQQQEREKSQIRNYELALRKQKFEEEQARGKEASELRMIGFKSLMDLENKIATDQNWMAGMSPEQRARTMAHREALRRQVTNNAATRDDWIRTFSMVPEKYPIVQQMSASGPQTMGQAAEPSTGSDIRYRIHSQEPVTSQEAYPSQSPVLGHMQGVLDKRVPNIDFQYRPPAAAPDFIPQQPKAPTIESLIAQGFTPEYAAKTVADYQRSLGSSATARYNTARAAEAEARGPYAGRQAEANLQGRRASTRYTDAATRALGGRLALDNRKFRESIRQFDLEFAQASGNAQQRLMLEGQAQEIAKFSAWSAHLLRTAQAHEIDAAIQKIRTELAQAVKINPRLKLLMDLLPELQDKTVVGTFANKERATLAADMIEGYGMEMEARMIRDYAAGATPNPVQGALEGATVPLQPGQQLPQGYTPPPAAAQQPAFAPMVPAGGMAVATPTGPAPGAQGLPPSLIDQFARQEEAFRNGTFAQPLAGRGTQRRQPASTPKTKQKTKTSAQTKIEQKRKLSGTFISAPTNKMSTKDIQAELDELKKKQRK